MYQALTDESEQGILRPAGTQAEILVLESAGSQATWGAGGGAGGQSGLAVLPKEGFP